MTTSIKSGWCGDDDGVLKTKVLPSWSVSERVRKDKMISSRLKWPSWKNEWMSNQTEEMGN